MNIAELVKQAHDNAVNHGFYECPDCFKSNGIGYTTTEPHEICPKCKGTGKQSDKNVGELLMLVVSELGEALEAHRKGRFANYNSFELLQTKGITGIMTFDQAFRASIKDTIQDELADAVIRIADMCGYLGIDLEKHIELKMKYNATREYKHGKRY